MTKELSDACHGTCLLFVLVMLALAVLAGLEAIGLIL